MSAEAFRYPALLAAALAFLGCSEEPVERTDLLSLTLTEAVTAVVDPEKDRLKAGTDTVTTPGTLNIEIVRSKRFSLAGVPIDFDPGQDGLERPDIRFLLYSPVVMTALRERVESGAGGGALSNTPLFSTKDLKAEIEKHQASDQIIGFVFTYYDDKSFAEMDVALRAELGTGRRIEQLERGDFWRVGDKIVVLAPDYNTIFAFHVSQAWQDCLLPGMIGVLDLGACDREAFAADLVNVIRSEPPNPPAK